MYKYTHEVIATASYFPLPWPICPYQDATRKQLVFSIMNINFRLWIVKDKCSLIKESGH